MGRAGQLAILAFAARPLGAALPGRDAVGKALDRAYTRPELAEGPKGWLTRLREWFLELCGDWIEWLWESLGLEASSPSVFWSMVVVLSSILALILARILVRTFGRRSVASRRPTGAPSSRPSATDGASRMLSLALALAAGGKHLEAMRALYLAVLLALDAHGRVRYVESKTGGEYAGELPGEDRRAFRSLLRLFYPIAFGGRTATPAAWDAMCAAARELGVAL